jgi:serine/threonine-protein kinase RsbT
LAVVVAEAPTLSETLTIESSSDVVRVRQRVREQAVALGFSLVDQTKLVTAASELGRNTYDYGGGGTVEINILDDGQRQGIRLVFADEGPGIPDIEQALRDGFTSGGGLGMGLGGSRRLVNEFEIESQVGKGTRITAVRWR